ncbi:MAG: polyprenyl synthetase family protein [Lachnospiraceae bacterium]|nr:polyprenyl synthetase family protein [Lachnospiraceae bacterium]
MESNLLESKIKHINEILKDRLPADEEYGRICESMSYSVLNGGKRLRAIMLLESFRLFCEEKDTEKLLAEPFVAAIEFIHAYSLVHDDLPAMDNDVLRRGKPTTHVAFGHAMGVLAGDALLNYAFETIGSICDDPLAFSGENGLRVIRAFRTLAVKAGYSGMIGGQVLDTTVKFSEDIKISGFDELDAFDDKNIDKEKLKYTLRVYELKTSQLFEAALMCGAILGGAEIKDIKLMEDAGRALGLAFQIEDDILDMTSNAETLGKSVNIDEKNDKDTVARMLGLSLSEELVKLYTAKAINSISALGRDAKFLLKLFESLIFRKL